jgi:transcription elongation GreA/GreB family factor
MMRFLEALRSTPVPSEYLALEGESRSPSQVDESDACDRVSPAKVAEALVFADEDEDLEVEIGDLVSYAPADKLDDEIRVRITPRLTNPDLGLVAETTPLGAVLMGATVGETVVLRVPSKPPQSFVVRSIKRAIGETTQ